MNAPRFMPGPDDAAIVRALGNASGADPADEKQPAPVRYHVHPLHGREHVTDGRPCWCAPTVTDDGLCIHREVN